MDAALRAGFPVAAGFLRGGPVAQSGVAQGAQLFHDEILDPVRVKCAALGFHAAGQLEDAPVQLRVAPQKSQQLEVTQIGCGSGREGFMRIHELHKLRK
jgi:hypothetical protein